MVFIRPKCETGGTYTHDRKDFSSDLKRYVEEDEAEVATDERRKENLAVEAGDRVRRWFSFIL